MRRAPSNPSGIKARLKRSDVVFTALVALVAALYLELFREACNAFRDGGGVALLSLHVTPGAAACFAGFAVLSFAVLLALQAQRKVLSRLFAWRYPIALAAFVALVALEVSGSSIALWGTLLEGVPNADLDGVAFGMPRSIRSDEYRVFTPMAFSQAHTGYAAISDIARGVPTDLTLIYAQPCWAVATLFRPFLWGYLLLGSARGLSFFWCGRLIALFLASFEFGRLITRDNHTLALAYALMVSLAPIVQWWFAVNGTVELLVFAQGGVLAFHAFLRAESPVRRIAAAALAAYSAGCFVMVIYPAWQACVAYVIVALCIADVVECRTRGLGALARGIGARRALCSWWLVLLGALAVVGALIAVALASSLDVIQTIRNTAYPGNRVATGGDLAPYLFDWAGSWLYALAFENATPNACERAAAFTLFPLGIAFALASLRRKRDPYLVALLVAEAVLLAYGLVGFPEWLAKLTLLSNVPAARLALALGLSDTILLVRGAAQLHDTQTGVSERPARAGAHAAGPAAATFPGALEAPETAAPAESSGLLATSPTAFNALAAVVSIAFGILMAVLTQFLHASFAFKVILVLCAAFVALFAYAALAFASGREGARKLACATAVLAIAGMCVNPVQVGAAALEDDGAIRQAAEVAAQDPGATWAGDSEVAAQALLSAGVKTINTVATYPDLGTWRKIDPTGAYEDCYNRYAHIDIHLTDEETSFELLANDAFLVNLNVDDIPKLGIGYWLSTDDLTERSTPQVAFTPLATHAPWTIYRLDC